MIKKVDVAELLDQGPFTPFQALVVLLCTVCLVMDGFDVQAMSYVAPVLIHEWGIAKEALSPVFGAGLLGMLIGSLTISTLADRYGRRPILVGATFFFSLCMFATGFAQSIEALIAWRFIAGLGLGCITPNAVTLVGEYSPRRVRVTLMMVVSCGFTIGGVVGGLIAAALIPEFGWRSVFFIGGALPFVLGLLMWFALPESVQFLIQRREGLARVRRHLERCAASIKDEPVDTVFLVAETKPKGAPLVALFQDGRARITGLLWVVNFCNLLDMYFLSNWLPTVIREAGYSTGMAVYAGTALWVGGVVGTVILGRIIDRVGFTPVLTTTFLLAVVATAAIGSPLIITSIFLLFLSIFLSGFAVIGGQPALNALAATYYPTALRSTGIGWSLGIGRIGSVVGPVAGGLLMHLHWSSTSLFIAAAVPAICSMLGVLCVHFVMRGQAAPRESSAYQ